MWRGFAMNQRSLGLDLVRGIIPLVIILMHTLLLIPNTLTISQQWLTWRCSYFGGVFMLDLFFAMSGFFLGQELIQKNNEPILQTLPKYLLNRWTRTLPVYYVILICMSVWLGMCEGGWWWSKLSWEHIFFLRQYSSEPYFLAVAWFLDVMQWSYLLLPLIILGIIRWMPQKWGSPAQRTAIVALVIIALEIIFRVCTLLHDPQLSMDDCIRKPVHLHLDALMYGLLIACCRLEYKRLYRWIQSKYCVGIVAICILVLLEMQYQCFYIRSGSARMLEQESCRIFFAGLGFSLSGLFAALLLPYLEQMPTAPLEKNFPRVYVFFNTTSKHSYSIFLIHLPIVIGFAHFVLPFLDKPLLGSIIYVVCMVCAWTITFKLSALAYTFVEQPAMWLRKKMLGIISQQNISN